MTKLRRRLLLLLAGAACVILLTIVGVPWWVNSGRATRSLERWLGDRIGGTATIADPHMDGWSRFSVAHIGARVGDTRIEVRGVDVPGPRYSGERAGSAGGIAVRITTPATHEEPGDSDQQAPPQDLPSWNLDVPALDTRVLRVMGWIGAFSSPVQVVVESEDATPSLDAQGELRALLSRSGLTKVSLDLNSAAGGAPLSATAEVRLDLARGTVGSVRANVNLPWKVVHERLSSSDIPIPEGALEATIATKGTRVDIEWSQPPLQTESVMLGTATTTATSTLGVPLSDMTWDIGSRMETVALGTLFSSSEATLSGQVTIDPLQRRLGWANVRLQPVGTEIQVQLEGAATGSPEGMHARSEVKIASMPLAQWAEYSPLAGRLISGCIGADGAVSLKANVDWGAAQQDITAEWHWTDGTFVIDDFRQAAGLNTTVSMHAARAETESWQIVADGSIGGGEMLWGSWYQELSDTRFPFEFRGTAEPDWAGFADASATVDLLGLGHWSVSGPLGFDGRFEDVQLRVKDFGLATAVEELLVPLLVETRPWVADATGSGTLGLDATISRGLDNWQAHGRLRVSDGEITDATDNVSFAGIGVDLPFVLRSGAQNAALLPPPDMGAVVFDGITVGGVHLEGAELPLQLWDNTFVIASPYRSRLFGGSLSLDAMWGVNLLSNDDREWQAEVSLEDLDLHQLSHAFAGFVPLTGQLNGRFSRIHFSDGDLDATGAIEATIYDGAFYLTQFGILDLRSTYRTYTAEIAWNDIDLEEATSTLGFGKITGRMKGAIRGLEVQAKQPAAFDAEFETVPTPGVPQRLSVQAVNNISLLGTGRGLGGILSRGLTQFFDDFKYETMGFRCTLKNDRFRIRGVSGDDTGEYFVKGTFLPPTINVINRDPKTVISFREMVRRFSAVDLSRVGGADASREGADTP